MAASRPTLAIAPEQPEIPAGLLRVCFALCVVNLTLGVVAYFSHWWIYDSDGLGIPIDFINVWAAGRLVLDGLPAQAYDWDIQKQIEVAKLGQDFVGYLPGTIPRRSCSSHPCWRSCPIRWHFIGWVLVSIAALSCGDARDRRPQLRHCARARRLRWCSSMRWSDRTAFLPRR